MNWLILVIAILYLMLGYGVESGVRSVKLKVPLIESLFITIFWPAVLFGLITIRLIKGE